MLGTMATKAPRTVYACQQCGYQSRKWLGKCPDCGAWNSFVEERERELTKAGAAVSRGGLKLHESKPVAFNSIEAQDEAREVTGIEEFDRVLGGGIVPGSLVLIGGEPGVGKSTLLTEVANRLSAMYGSVLYVSGEESARQIKLRGERMDINPANLFLLSETSLERIFDEIDRLQPQAIIIDSVQTVFSEKLESAPGSVSQVREVAGQFLMVAKNLTVPIFLIGHVTKEGTIAGPRVLEHVVDTVLYLEGDRFQAYRLLRSVKNRFGATAEVGVFEMREGGLVEVTNPSEAFLAERMINAAGSAIAVTMEGTRPILVEVQGLTSPTQFGNARRTANGVDFNRLLLISAVLTRRAGLKLAEQDIFVNVVGGLQIDEPAADLAIAAAIASSWRDISVKADAVLIGEIGLAGELRMPGQMVARLREAQKLGFKTAIIPTALRKAEPYPSGIEIIEVRAIHQALDAAFALSKELPKGRKVA